jgi:anti-sigma B factor antagonist
VQGASRETHNSHNIDEKNSENDGNKGHEVPNGKEPPTPFRFLVHFRNEPAGVVLVALHDDLDLNVANPLLRLLDELVQQGREGNSVLHMVLDMTAVVFMDSSALKILLEIRRRLVERGGTLRLFGAPRQIMRVLKIANLQSYLPAHQTETEAIQAIQTLQQEERKR